jgi:hypothetical protein
MRSHGYLVMGIIWLGILPSSLYAPNELQTARTFFKFLGCQRPENVFLSAKKSAPKTQTAHDFPPPP